jgi:hypothetical protein
MMAIRNRPDVVKKPTSWNGCTAIIPIFPKPRERIARLLLRIETAKLTNPLEHHESFVAALCLMLCLGLPTAQAVA